LIDGEEKAFVSIDHREDLNSIVLYELFVPESLRGKGIGRHVLNCIEKFASRRNYDRIVLVPEPLDGGVEKQRLVRWYKRAGYADRPDSRGELEKLLSRRLK
jgi:GNAT superfamily N-acetyltransferase